MEHEQKSRRRGGERLIGLFVLGCVLFSPPFVVLVGGGIFLGLPATFTYLFLAWAVVVTGLALVIEAGARRPRRRERQP